MTGLRRNHYLDKSAYIAYTVCMTSRIQYTIRNIPPAVDGAIRKRSARTGMSFNQTVVDLLALQTFGTTRPPADDNFDWLYGQNTLDDAFDEAIAEQSLVDEKLWR